MRYKSRDRVRDSSFDMIAVARNASVEDHANTFRTISSDAPQLLSICSSWIVLERKGDRESILRMYSPDRLFRR